MSCRIFQHCPLADYNYRRHPEGSHLTEPTQHRKPGELLIRQLPLFYPTSAWVGLLWSNNNQSFSCAFIVKPAKAIPGRMALTAC